MGLAKRAVLGLMIACAAAGTARPAEHGKRDLALIRARILYYYSGDDAFLRRPCEAEPPLECVSIGGYFKIRFKVQMVLAGKFEPDYFTAYVSTVSERYLDGPRDPNAKMYMVVEPEPDGSINAAWWSQAAEGLCLDDDTLKQLGDETGSPQIEAQARGAAKRYPCKLEDEVP